MKASAYFLLFATVLIATAYGQSRTEHDIREYVKSEIGFGRIKGITVDEVDSKTVGELFDIAINAVDTLLKDAIEKNPSEVTPEFIQGAEEFIRYLKIEKVKFEHQ